MPSTPTVLVEPPTDPKRVGAHVEPARPVDPQRRDYVEAAPTTERMMRAAGPLPQPTTLALRPWEPQRPQRPFPGPLDDRLVLLAEPDSPRAAGFRVLRDGLIGKNLPRVVAVSSAAPKDGKTTCAINLALALSEQSTTKVLLIDANFFEPELAQIFMLERLPPVTPPESWLAPYTIGEVTSSLHVAGILRGDVGKRRFEQHRFEALIDRLCRVSYDYLIIDTPALRGTPAVTTLIAGADATILAVRAGGTTTGRDIRRAADQIPANKALGIALIDAGPQS
jgi:Mrp family chromosome partitioning ATPase